VQLPGLLEGERALQTHHLCLVSARPRSCVPRWGIPVDIDCSLKVLKVPESSTTWYQKGLLVRLSRPDRITVLTLPQSSELQDIFAASPPTPNGSLMVSTKVRAAYLRATGAGGEEEEVAAEVEKEVEAMTAGGKRSSIGDDCPV
jgi:hypothetical protein